MKCIKVLQDSDFIGSFECCYKNGESLDSYTTISFSIMIFCSLVQSNQQDSAVLAVKVTPQYITEAKLKKNVGCTCSSLYIHILLLYYRKPILKRENYISY